MTYLLGAAYCYKFAPKCTKVRRKNWCDVLGEEQV